MTILWGWRGISNPATAPEGAFGISRAAELLLREDDWPGNVRELQNTVERAIVLATSNLLRPDDFTLPVKRDTKSDASLTNPVASHSPGDIGRAQLEAALIKTGSDCREVAALLNKSVATVYRNVKRHGLSYLLKRPRDQRDAKSAGSVR